MIVVIDTNVFVGACLGSPSSSEVLATCLSGEHQPLVGAALLSEYEDVLGRTHLWTKCRLSAVEREELLDIFVGACRWTRIYFGWRPNLRDEGDNHLIELAVAGNAEHIVTRNIRDIGSMDLRFPQLKISTPKDFLRELKK